MEFSLKRGSKEAVYNAIYEINQGDGFWYAVNNGYIEPEKILEEGEGLNKVREAVNILSLFEEFLLDREGE